MVFAQSKALQALNYPEIMGRTRIPGDTIYSLDVRHAYNEGDVEGERGCACGLEIGSGAETRQEQ